MKHQQVSVDYWAMGKAMVTYGALTALVWLMLKLVGAVFTLPRRLRAQQENMETTLRELQKRYPDLNITEEDLKNAEKEFDELMKENKENKEKSEKENAEITEDGQDGKEIPAALEEDKKNS